MSAVVRIDRADLAATALTQLERDFVEAFDEIPQSLLRTPGWRTSQSTVSEIVYDELAGDSEVLHQVLQVVSNASRGIDVTLAAMALKRKLARLYAEAHCDDVASDLRAEAMEGPDE